MRSGLLEILPALATFGGALVFAVFGIVLALGAFIVIWTEGIDGGGYAFTALAIGVLLLAYPAYLGVRAYRLPMINDITTDPINPPRFDVVARLRPRGTVEYAGLYAAEQQRAAYPDIEPLEVSATAAGRLRRRARGHHQAQVAHRGRALAAGRPPRRPDRGGGAHGRSWDSATTWRCASAPTRDGARDRRALGLALRQARPRRQCLAHPQPAGGHRRRGQRAHRPAGAAQRQKKPPPKPAPAKGQPAKR